MGLVGRFRIHFVGKVAVLASATAFSVLVSFALLPLTTQQLGASDYGTYTLLMSIVILASSSLDGGSNVILPAHYHTSAKSEKAKILASVISIAGASTVAVSLLFMGAWILFHEEFATRAVPIGTVILTAALIPMRAWSSIFITAFSVTGRSGAIAAILCSQAILVFIGTVVSLFCYSMGGMSLFIGTVCGQFSALCVCAIVLWRDDEFALPTRLWLRVAIGSMPLNSVTNFSEGVRSVIETAILVSCKGLAAAGAFSHARLYYNLSMTLCGTVGHNVRTISLDNARDPFAPFGTTHRAWGILQLGFACLGIVFAFFGNEIVGIVSTGKLTEAATYIPVFFIIALIQTTEQPAEAIVLVSKQAVSAIRFRLALSIIVIVALYPSIFLLGIKGILALSILEVTAYRVSLHVLAAREREVPSEYLIPLGCLLAIGSAQACAEWFTPSFDEKVLFVGAGFWLIAILGRHSIVDLISVCRRIVFPSESV